MRRYDPRIGLAIIGVGAALLIGATQAHAACVGGAPNGVEESGEACDFGSDPNDCCSDSCAFLAVGTACDDYDICSMNTTCDSEGQCSGVPDPTKPRGTDCDDHNDCTTSDDCNGLGHCVGGAGQTGEQCRHRDVAGNFTDCKTRLCQGKECSGAIVGDPCDDGNACTVDTCTNPATSSCDPVHPAIPVGGSCDTDENNCTVETCHDDDLNGITECQTDTTITCTDANLDDCKYPSCNPATAACDIIKKKEKGAQCGNDGNICTVDQCSSTGKCTHPAVSIPTACNDGNSCTANDMCDGKTCAAGSALANGASCASDSNDCTLDFCVSATCTHQATNTYSSTTTNGVACASDGIFCTLDFCSGGVCSHSGTNTFTSQTTNGQTCTDANVCTDTSACTNGQCLGTACAPGTCTTACGSAPCGTTIPYCGCTG